MLKGNDSAAQRPGGTPLQGQPSGQQQQPPPPTHGYSNPYANANPPPATPYNIPQPSNSGSLDLSNIKPVHSGSVSLADAIARARGIAAEKGVSFDTGRGGGSGSELSPEKPLHPNQSNFETFKLTVLMQRPVGMATQD